jgi:hypothetical protein
MTNLRPPDGRVFVEIEQRVGKQVNCIVKSVGNNTDFEVGQRVCILGKLEKVELQDVELYSVNSEFIAFVYED